jgi:hypothetical protein
VTVNMYLSIEIFASGTGLDQDQGHRPEDARAPFCRVEDQIAATLSEMEGQRRRVNPLNDPRRARPAGCRAVESGDPLIA